MLNFKNLGSTLYNIIGMVLILCVTLCGCSSSDDESIDNYSSEAEIVEAEIVKLSDDCDYLLCYGVDNAGNEYELVANQTESALGFEITVGVIKNNEWIYPLSKEFPFLDEDNLFHISVSSAGESGHSLTNPYPVIGQIYFVDSGAFLMEKHKAVDVWGALDIHTYTLFSCDTLSNYVFDCHKSNLFLSMQEADIYDRKVFSYGNIDTVDGKIFFYAETPGTHSVWEDDRVFDWATIDVKTLEVTTIASSVKDIRPRSQLSEGLIFASDKCFYDTNFQKIIDLSAYNIDMSLAKNYYFMDGVCTFYAENNIGTEFQITIDKDGNILEEIAQ